MTVTQEAIELSLEHFDAWMDLEGAVRDDALGLLHLLDDAPDDQTRRRAFVRGAWAYKEGCLNGLAKWVATVEDLTGTQHPKRPDNRTSQLKRIKATLRWATHERLTPGWQPDFGVSGWEAVRKSLSCRDRLMHPKSAKQFQVADEELEAAKDGLAWFVSAVSELQKRALERAVDAPLTPTRDVVQITD